VFARGPWTAALLQLLAGASLAGTYMPGLKLIADRVDGVPHPRHVAFYTTSFTIGSSLSFYAVGQLFEWVTWQTAVLAIAAGPVIAWLLIYGLLRPVPTHARTAVQSHWRTVFQSPDAMRYVLGYACHMWELFAVRAWLVPFLAFCESLAGRPPFGTAATLAALISLVGVPASFAGAELTTRVDRRKLLTIVMSASAFVSLAIGSTALASWSVILLIGIAYSATVSADSAALTSGIVAVSDPQSRGTAMALYSTAGFAAASAGSFAIGVLLDLLGGQTVFSWTLAFAAMGASNLVGLVLLRRANK
jgi:predicted MFS family arabinose efflux permease